MSQENPVKRQIWHCGYCRTEVKDAGFWASGIIYCSKSCRELGFFNQVKANQSPWYIVLAVIATLLTMAATSYFSPAYSHEPYSGWTIPGQNKSCCNTMDCAPTRAKYEQGHWWAFVISKKIWVQVPEDRIVRYKISDDDTSAHLCYGESFGEVYCFRPPPTGF